MRKSQCFFVVMVLGLVFSMPVGAISEGKKTAIIEGCDSIKESLELVQHQDSRARVYLGRYYETVLSKYITPLNVRLVENNLFNSELMDNQDNFSRMRSGFIVDFIEYQRELEKLVSTDCKTEPEKFYERLVKTRERRQEVAIDTAGLKELMTTQLKLVEKLKEGL